MRSEKDWDFLLNSVGQNRDQGYGASLRHCRVPGCGGGNSGDVCWLCGSPFYEPLPTTAK